MLRLAGVERSFERLGRVCEAEASKGLSDGATPKRDVGSGGSMAGRKNMKVQCNPLHGSPLSLGSPDTGSGRSQKSKTEWWVNVKMVLFLLDKAEELNIQRI